MGALRDYAELELAAIGYDENCEDFDMWMRDSVLALIDTFSSQGHSGFSANECLNLFNKLARMEPLKPIMCTDDEWSDVSDKSGEPFYQNRRHSAIFKKGKDAKPYFLDAIIWIDENDCSFTGTVEGITSSQPIRIPFTPKSFRIRIDSECKIIERENIKIALEYYDYHGSVLVETIDMQ